MAIGNMPSLALIREILGNDPLFAKPTTRPVVPPRPVTESVLIDLAPSGMHVAMPVGSVRITDTCPRMAEELPDHCSLNGTQECPADQSGCPTC